MEQNNQNQNQSKKKNRHRYHKNHHQKKPRIEKPEEMLEEFSYLGTYSEVI